MFTFGTFRDGLGSHFCKRLFRIDITSFSSWTELREAALASRQAFGGEEGGNVRFVAHVENNWGKASTGERAVIAAILMVIDYSHLANRLSSEHSEGVLHYFEYVTGTHALACAACIAKIDDKREGYAV